MTAFMAHMDASSSAVSASDFSRQSRAHSSTSMASSWKLPISTLHAKLLFLLTSSLDR